MEKKTPKELIVDLILDKFSVKKVAYENTQKVFEALKLVCQTVALEYNTDLKGKGRDTLIIFRDKGYFEAELQVGEDLIIFSLHSNVFNFDKNHTLWRTSYLHNQPNASFCGVINIYNFLTDSFKFNRQNDIGYLIARIFINKDNHYFVEGKRQLGFLYNDFPNATIDNTAIRNILESCILFTLDFDLLVPDYDNVNNISVAQMIENINNSKTLTAKRLGFKFNVDNNEI